MPGNDWFGSQLQREMAKDLPGGAGAWCSAPAQSFQKVGYSQLLGDALVAKDREFQVAEHNKVHVRQRN